MKARLLSDRACSAVLAVVSTPVSIVTRSGGAVTVPLPATLIVRADCACERERRERRKREARKGIAVDVAMVGVGCV